MSNLFSILYLPPATYIEKIAELKEITIDRHEHFVKQSYRSRCSIYGPNGKLDLIIPVVHSDLQIKPIAEVRISNSDRWQKIHWRSITTAYKNSPYFEFYEDDFQPFYEKKYDWLFEFNYELLQLILKIKNINIEINFTEKYESSLEIKNDFRHSFHPKKEFTKTNKYHQVFEDRHGFIDRLSVIDQLFNTR